jgi:flagellar motor switch protein FliN
MSDTDAQVPLPDLNAPGAPATSDIAYHEDENAARIAADLEAVFDVPVQVSAVLGRSKMEVGELLKLGPGTVLELDRRVGEAIDIYVNNRLVARGEVVMVDDNRLGVTKRWPGKFGQSDKWSFCLRAARVPRIRSDNGETSTPDPQSGLQGESGPCGR